MDEAAREGRIRQGTIRLQPAWRQDYAALARDFVASLPPEVASAPAAASAAPAAPAPVELPPIAFATLPRPVPEGEANALFRGSAPLKISVVLPAANEGPFLQRTFDQFRATLPAPSEIIVVDNGSTDGSADFLAAACADGDEDGHSIAGRLVRTPGPLGVSGARNRGLECARGEIVVFADAHVDVPPGWWPPMVAALSRPEVGLIGPAIGVMGDPNYVKMYGQRVADWKLRTEWLPKRRDEPYPVPALGGGFMALRRDVLDAIGGFDAGMLQWGSEDFELSLRVWLFGYEVWVVPEVEVAHYFRQQNPYPVEWKHVSANVIRTAFLHLGEDRLARVLHSLMQDIAHFPRALAFCADSDVLCRRAELKSRRVHDDDWFFNHPYFADIEMPR